MRFMEKFDKIFAAVAFAEEGEHETALRMLKQKKALLVLRGMESDRASIKYALNIAKRIGASVEVLCVSNMEAAKTALRFIEEETKKAGIEFAVVYKSGSIHDAVLAHTEKRDDIQFVVVESSDMMDVDCTGNRLQGFWKRLKCPLVAVSDGMSPVKA